MFRATKLGCDPQLRRNLDQGKSSVVESFEMAVAVPDLLDLGCETNGVDNIVVRNPFSVFDLLRKTDHLPQVQAPENDLW